MSNYFTLIAASVALALFLALLGMIEVGLRTGRRRAALDPERGREGLGGAEGAVYGLLGLLIAFAFSGAASRFEKRRELIVDEANAIGTAYLRIDLLAAEAQPALRQSFRNYLDARLAAYRKLPNVTAAQVEFERAAVLQGELWREAVAATRGSPMNPAIVLGPVNEMFDLASARAAQAYAHPPLAIPTLLITLALVSAFIVGFGMAGNQGRSGLHTLAYAAVMSMVLYLILDLEFPRLGVIRVDSIDQVLVDARKAMN